MGNSLDIYGNKMHRSQWETFVQKVGFGIGCNFMIDNQLKPTNRFLITIGSNLGWYLSTIRKAINFSKTSTL